MTYQPNRPTPRAYWANADRDFPVFVGVKRRLPSRAELIALSVMFRPMWHLHERGLNPEGAITSAEQRYLLHDLASPYTLWPALQAGVSLRARLLDSKHALVRAERRLRLTLVRIDRGPPSSPKGPIK